MSTDGIARALVRDGLLGRWCMAWWAPHGTLAAERLTAAIDRLEPLEHPALAQVVHRFAERRSTTLAGIRTPVVGVTAAWTADDDAFERLSGAEPAERLEAMARLLDLVAWLHGQGMTHGALTPDAIDGRPGALRVLPGVAGGVARAAPGQDALRADRIALATLARALRVEGLPEGSALRGLADDDTPDALRRALASLAQAGVTVPTPTPTFPLDLLDDLVSRVGDPPPARGRPLVLVGARGTLRARLARRLIGRRAAQGLPTLDLSRARSPLLALHRLLLPPEHPPSFDDAWSAAIEARLEAEGLEHALFLGCLDATPSAERARLAALATPLARAGAEVWLADTAPRLTGSVLLPMAPLTSADAARLARGNGRLAGPGLERLRRAAAGRAHPLLQQPLADLPAMRRLAILPTGVPSRVVAALPDAVRRALPALSRAGIVRFDDDGALHHDVDVPPRTDGSLLAAIERALLDPLGELDPLWLAVTWARLGRSDRAADLFDRAREAAAGRTALLAELARRLAPTGHGGAALLSAEISLARRAPHRALAALAALPNDERVAILRARAFTALGRPTEALALLGTPDDRGGAWWLARGWACLAARDREGALRAAVHARASAGPATRREGLVLAAHVAIASSDPDDLRADLAAMEPNIALLVAHARLSLRGDDRADAAERLARAATHADTQGAPLLATALRLVAGRAWRHAGLPDRAVDILRDALATAQLAGATDLANRALAHLASAAAQDGDLVAAAALRDRLVTLREPSESARVPMAHALARVALAEGDADAAWTALERVDLPSCASISRREHGELVALAFLAEGRAAKAGVVADALDMPADHPSAARLAALRGTIRIAEGNALLREARRRLHDVAPPAVEATLRAMRRAWDVTGLVGDPFSDATVPPARNAPEGATEPTPALRVVPTAPPASRSHEVLGVILEDPVQAELLETTLTLLDADRSNNILLTGPTGAGKRVFAERIAREQLGLDGLEEVVLRRMDPQMLVGLLVGTRRGEFTGALDQSGAIHRAIAGRKALLLDEIHTLDRAGQEILLPLLELPQRRFGGLIRSSTVVEAPLQILLATNEDVTGSRWRDVFRADLWFRMSQHHVHLPPLSERGPDATLRYLGRMLADDGVADPEDALTPHALHTLIGQPWEGNLRELAGVARRIARLVGHRGRRLDVDDLRRVTIGAAGPNVERLPTRDVLETLELNAVLEALRRCEWSQTAAAERLGVSKYRLRRILDKHELIEWVRTQRSGAAG